MAMLFFRRQLLQAAAALPVMGCTLDSEGSLFGNNDSDSNTTNETDGDTLQPPFDHKVILNLVSYRSLERDFTLTVTFKADVTGLATPRTSSQVLKHDATNQLTENYPVGDPNVIDLSEEGTVSCECKFEYDTGEIDNVAPVTHNKVAGDPLPEFNLTFVNDAYVLT